VNSTIRLFKSVPVNSIDKTANPSEKILKKTIKRGFIFAPEVIGNFNDRELENLIEAVEEEVGLTAQQMNASFHKSWKKVATAPIEQLILEQIFHYITTYGYEQLGCYNSDSVYIPVEKLKVPKTDLEKIRLTVIHGYTKDQLKLKIITLLGSGIALSEQSVKDSIDICEYVQLNDKEVNNVRNKEVKVALYQMFNMVPSDPTEFLRYVIYKLTDSTLLIKNRATIQKIKESPNLNQVYSLFEIYGKKNDWAKLSQVFLRFKPIFLALKNANRMSGVINHLRRLAKTNHKPMPVDYLNSVTAMISQGKKITNQTLKIELAKVNTFRKIRLMYALNYRLTNALDIMYKIRNGASYATDFSFSNQKEASRVMEIVKESIIEDVCKNIKGKTILIPKSVHYALPATEKQFTGDIPSGSYVELNKDMVVGVHWFNLENDGLNYYGGRVDLDLSLSNTSGKYGWDGNYRSGNADIMFSGDITDAPQPKGASELFYIQRQTTGTYLMNLNNFNLGDTKVPFKILVAKKRDKEFGRNYMVNPNEVICVAKTNIQKSQKTLGMLEVSNNKTRFYFSESDTGNQRTSRFSKGSDHALKYFINYCRNPISLNDILLEAGATIVHKLEKDQTVDIDLSPENLTKESFIQLLN
jgi:hypothetical protein